MSPFQVSALGFLHCPRPVPSTHVHVTCIGPGNPTGPNPHNLMLRVLKASLSCPQRRETKADTLKQLRPIGEGDQELEKRLVQE
jgi:hypothetical protein